MTKKILLKNVMGFMMLCGFGLCITSCSNEEEDTIVTIESTENFVNQSVFSLQTEGNIGRMGCFEFVFPIGINYPDGSNETVDDYDMLRSSLSAWYTDNADELGITIDSAGRIKYRVIRDVDAALLPTLDFPLEIITENGELYTVDNKAELLLLKIRCRRSYYQDRRNINNNRGDKCFSLVYPITIVLPDETTFIAEDRADLKSQLREWRAANPDAEERPTLQFPVIVQLEDESTVELESKEGLQELKDTCSQD